jgi:nitrate/TMAO reductase-like tetraheme cytochrome c subunit
MTIEEKREKNRIKNVLWRQKNRPRYNQLINQWKLDNPDEVRQYKWKERYNITPEHYDEMVKSQNNRCAICGNVEIAKHNITKKVQKLAVDHCHSSGKVRGLLCQDCNRGLGKFHDNIQRLENAIKYLTARQGS